jgi:tetratricopeptide (TPR) repeat protein
MKKGSLACFLSVALVALSGCGSGAVRDQLRFGIWASEHELWDEAIYRWKRVLEENPRSVSAHNNLGVAYEKKGLWEEALKEYETASKLDPENSYVKYNFDRFKSAREAVKKDREETEKDGGIKEKDGEKGGYGQ